MQVQRLQVALDEASRGLADAPPSKQGPAKALVSNTQDKLNTAKEQVDQTAIAMTKGAQSVLDTKAAFVTAQVLTTFSSHRMNGVMTHSVLPDCAQTCRRCRSSCFS